MMKCRHRESVSLDRSHDVADAHLGAHKQAFIGSHPAANATSQIVTQCPIQVRFSSRTKNNTNNEN